MADSDPRPPPSAPAGGGIPPLSPEAKSALGGLGQIADFLSKVGGVAIAAAVGFTGYYLQKSATESQLLNQREQAETSVRAEMFKTVAEKVVKAKAEITWSEKAVFAEILALNFHQHIELKPLLLDIERQLLRECAHDPEPMLRAGARRRHQCLHSQSTGVRASGPQVHAADRCEQHRLRARAGCSRGRLQQAVLG